MRFLEGKFCLRKWRTYDPELRKEINNLENTDNVEVTPEKILGLIRDEKSDKIVYDFKHLINSFKNIKVTKRNVLSTICSIYDPFGIIQPLIISLKILFQKICKGKVEWDSPLPVDLHRRWTKLLNEMKELVSFECNRKYFERNENDTVVEYQLHGFSDASPTAYGAIIYLVAKTANSKTHVAFVTSKSRVAPIKPQTVPCTELLGNVLLVRLLNLVEEALKKCVTITSKHFYTDSKVCLAWIKASNCEFNSFVENRVKEIRQSSDIEQWNYCNSTTENPADLI